MQQQQQHQQQEMESTFYSELQEGEHMLWSGKPVPGSRNSASPTGVFTVLAIVFGTIGLAMLITGFILLSIPATKGIIAAYSVMFGVGGPFTFVGLLMTIFAITFRQALRGIHYAITDRRIILFNTGNTRIVTSYGRADIGSITRIERQDGTGDLIFAQGRAPGYGYSYSYSYGYAGNRAESYSSGTYGPRTMGAMAGAGRFTGIPNVREVEHILIRTFKTSQQDY